MVTIRVSGVTYNEAERAIARGFSAVAEVHRLMSFHEVGSDLSRLNRGAWHHPVTVDPQVVAVIRQATDIADASRGIFDPVVAGDLVARGALPRPLGAPEPDRAASWRDIAIDRDSRIRFARPLWIDLGGIAKGHAVDRALAAMDLPPKAQVVVDAGGDLRVAGPSPEPVQLGPDLSGAVPIVELADGALASSTSAPEWGARLHTHLDGSTRRPVGRRSFTAVAAPSCMIADALTKPVLALGVQADPLLRRFGAAAYLHRAGSGWTTLGQG